MTFTSHRLRSRYRAARKNTGKSLHCPLPRMPPHSGGGLLPSFSAISSSQLSLERGIRAAFWCVHVSRPNEGSKVEKAPQVRFDVATVLQKRRSSLFPRRCSFLDYAASPAPPSAAVNLILLAASDVTFFAGLFFRVTIMRTAKQQITTALPPHAHQRGNMEMVFLVGKCSYFSQ